MFRSFSGRLQGILHRASTYKTRISKHIIVFWSSKLWIS